MISIEHRAEAASPATEQLLLNFDTRSKCRFRTRLASNEEVGVFLERGRTLRSGDKLLTSDNRVVEVIAADEALFEADCADPLLLLRAAYHLGNRHVPVQIDRNTGWLRFAVDHVLRDMVRGLGLAVREIVAPFEPEAGAYAHHEVPSHSHGDATAQGAKLHQYRQRA